jgi:hypothetical protein
MDQGERNMRRLICTCLLLALLGGCATAAENEVERQQQALKEGREAATACWDRAESLQAFKMVEAKLPSRSGPISMALQANTSRLTPEEATALLDFHREGLSVCRELMLQSAAKVSALLPPVLAEAFAAQDQQYVRLIKREISWGDYATAAVQRRAAFDAAIAKAGQQNRNQLEASHDREMARRAQAAQAMQTYIYQQQVINAINRPVTTNCYRVGAMVNCTSY